MVALLLYLPFIAAAVGAMLAGLLVLGNILPTSAIAAAITAANGYIGIIHEIVPNTTVSLMAIVGSFLLVEYFAVSYKLIKWIYSKLPGVT
ncbi:MAG: hypothetical protein KGJ13_12465 [Patescibacteria group bacterium]|nr:hypothetical protein [Patescibacteria group bacterium]